MSSTVKDYKGLCPSRLSVREINLRACALVILNQIIRPDRNSFSATLWLERYRQNGDQQAHKDTNKRQDFVKTLCNEILKDRVNNTVWKSNTRQHDLHRCQCTYVTQTHTLMCTPCFRKKHPLILLAIS